MKVLELLIIVLVIVIICVVISWFFSGYISHHLHIPFILVFLIGVLFPPLWWLMMGLAVLVSLSHHHAHPPAPYPPAPYPPPPYPPR